MRLHRYLGTIALAFLLLLVPSGLSVQAQSAGFTISAPSATTTSEAGTTVTFTVVLNTKPTANVHWIWLAPIRARRPFRLAP